MKTKYEVVEKESKGLGIASMVIGLVGVFVAWIPLIGIPFCTIGLILGLVQKNWTKHGMAITGVALNGVFCFIQVTWIALMVIGLMMGA